MKLTLLISSAGRRNHLIECFRADARLLNIDLRVLATDINPSMSPACHCADTSFSVPICGSDKFILTLLNICQQERVDLLIPTIDPELACLAAFKEEFSAIGTRVVISSLDVIQMANDKYQTSAILKAAGIRIPRTVRLSDYLDNHGLIEGQVIAKPNSGSGSIGIIKPESPAELKGLATDRYIVQERLEGDEYTVNLFVDKMGTLRSAVPHHRIEVRSGEVSKGRTKRIASLENTARLLVKALPGARGPLCFQGLGSEEDGYAIFEINARFGGGFPLAHAAGAAFSRWLLEEAAGLSSTAGDEWAEGVTMLRYDAAVFIR